MLDVVLDLLLEASVAEEGLEVGQRPSGSLAVSLKKEVHGVLA